jgi:uncharacterized protein (TIGR00297 family)
MTRPRSSEHARQVVHIAMGAFALLLRYLTWWQAAVLAGLAIAFNVKILPRIGGRRLYRPTDVARGFPSGIVLYPIAVVLLLLLFPDRLDIVAAAWGIMAVGDGLATIVGRAAGGRTLPWNREKTLAGTVTLAVTGGVAGAFLCWWVRPAVLPPPYLWFSLGAPLVAAAAAAGVESIPVRLDDNLSVPLSAAGVLFCLSLVSEDLALAALSLAAERLLIAAALNGTVAWAGYAARTVSLSGALCGAAIGTTIFIAAGWQGWVLLLATFVLAAATTRMGLERKTLLGIAEERGGRRGAANAVANTGVAAVAALMSILTYAREPALVAFAAALAAGGSDTVASEIGKAWGRRTYLVPTFTRVSPGTSGAISAEGTAAGLVAALALATAAAALQLVSFSTLAAIVGGATAGALVESALGATLEPPGILNNDLLNFFNTAVAAIVALSISGRLG